MHPAAFRFTLPDASAAALALAALRDARRLRTSRPRRRVYRFVDSFDGRLYAAGLQLAHLAGRRRHRLQWGPADESAPPRLLAVPRPVRFAHELPAGPLRRTLDDVLAPRVLLPLAVARCREQAFDVLNDDDKTVARLLLRTRCTARAPDGGRAERLPAHLVIRPVRGYRREEADLRERLEALLGPSEPAPGLFLEILAALDLRPDAHTSKLDLALDPAEPAHVALRHVFLHFLDTIERNEPGLRADLDVEFLHDFRVAVRRTRAILGQFRKAFPPEDLVRFRADFQWLGQVTGPTRDLDVFLLDLDGHLAAFSNGLGANLAPLRALIRGRRREAQAAMVDALDAPRYRTLRKDWRAFLRATPADLPEGALRPIREAASARIRRAWERVRERGLAVGPETPAAALHALRIECKKLRYLLEVFRSLYPPDDLDAVVRVLKQLQDNLGTFQDCEVQQQHLTGFARAMDAEGRGNADTFLAMGRLEAYLAERQRTAQDAFHDTFARFDAPRNRRRFARCFAEC